MSVDVVTVHDAVERKEEVVTVETVGPRSDHDGNGGDNGTDGGGDGVDEISAAMEKEVDDKKCCDLNALWLWVTTKWEEIERLAAIYCSPFLHLADAVTDYAAIFEFYLIQRDSSPAECGTLFFYIFCAQ